MNDDELIRETDDLARGSKNLYDKLDFNHDGKIEASDILNIYDTDGDGTLSLEELSKLATQLATQVDYNNKLLSQLTKLETTQLKHQKESKEKSNSLIEALKLVDALTGEVNRLRSDHTKSVEEISKLSSDLHSAKLEASLANRERDDLKNEYERVGTSMSQLEKEGEEGRFKMMQESSKSNMQLAEARKKLAALTSMSESYDKMNREKDSVLKEMERRAKDAEDKAADLQAKYNDIKSKSAASVSSLAQLSSKNKELEDMNSALAASDKQSKTDLKNIEMRNSKLEERLKVCLSATTLQDNEMNNVKAMLEEEKNKNKALKEGTGDVEKQLFDVKKQLEALEKSKANDYKKLSEGNESLTSFVTSLQQKGREREIEHAAELNRLSESFSNAKKKNDDNYIKVKEESNANKREIERLNAEIGGYKIEIEQLNAEVEEMNDDHEKRHESLHVVHKEVVEKEKKKTSYLSTELFKVRSEMASRTQHFIHLLAAIQTQIKVMYHDVQEGRENRGELEEMVKDVCKKVKYHSGSSPELQIISNFGEGVSNFFKKINEELSNTVKDRDRLISERDAVEAKNRQQVEEVNELRKQVLAANDQLSAAAAKNSMQVKELEVKLKSAIQASIAESHLREHAENEIFEKDNEIDQNIQTIRELREEISKMKNDKDDEVKGSTSKLADALKENEEMKGKYEAVIKTLSELEDEREVIHRRLRDSANSQTALKAQLKNMEISNVNTENGYKVKIDTLSKHIKGLNDGMKKFETQISETQKLLNVVQEQREHLQTDNVYLRGELDEIYTKAINSNGKDVSIPMNLASEALKREINFK